MSQSTSTVLAVHELTAQIRDAAESLDQDRFLELLRWHRAVVGLSDLDWSAPGAFRLGVDELDQARAAELLQDVRRVGRDPRSGRRGADGKPQFRGGRTLRQLRGRA